jgi:hypothetical protein
VLDLLHLDHAVFVEDLDRIEAQVMLAPYCNDRQSLWPPTNSATNEPR